VKGGAKKEKTTNGWVGDDEILQIKKGGGITVKVFGKLRKKKKTRKPSCMKLSGSKIIKPLHNLGCIGTWLRERP